MFMPSAPSTYLTPLIPQTTFHSVFKGYCPQQRFPSFSQTLQCWKLNLELWPPSRSQSPATLLHFALEQYLTPLWTNYLTFLRTYSLSTKLVLSLHLTDFEAVIISKYVWFSFPDHSIHWQSLSSAKEILLFISYVQYHIRNRIN